LTSNPISVQVDVKLANVQIESVYGKFKPDLPEEKQSINMDMIPSFMKEGDVTLDITKPVIVLKTASNIGIPVNVSLDLKPYLNGSLLTDAQQSIRYACQSALSIG
jgi:hypothetical protein